VDLLLLLLQGHVRYILAPEELHEIILYLIDCINEGHQFGWFNFWLGRLTWGCLVGLGFMVVGIRLLVQIE